jgi:predicted nucleotidyltransferase
MTENVYQTLARQMADLFSRFPQVEAVAVSGSITSGALTDLASDIDLYVYTSAVIPIDARLALVEAAGGASRADMNLDYWDLGDEWFHAPSGIEIDVMYWDTRWIEEMIARVVTRHQASIGYSTSHWHTIRTSRVLFDRSGWFQRLQTLAETPYPEPLRQAIICRNHSLLRGVIPAYLHQVEKAARRGDLISVNHRVAALLASYFDILFACNRVLHPGEKRLLEQAHRICARLPEGMTADVTAVLQAAGIAGETLLAPLKGLLDHLDDWLAKEEPWLFER